MRTLPFWLGLLTTMIFLGAPLSGCFGSSASPCQGGLRCNCYANSSCNPGLSCRSNVCVVEPDDSGTPTPLPEDDAATTDEDAASQDDTQAQTTPDSPAAGGPNVVTNGDFSQGATNWAIVAGNGTFTASGGKGCVAVGATQLNQTVTLGWPEPPGSAGAVLLSGTSYTFSYSASSMAAPISIDAKVGQTTSPYTADFETGADAVTTQVTPFSHTFTASPGDPSAGVAFAFTAAAPETVCFQNVSLVQN
jgi:Carbohydrate binding domain